MKAPEKIYLKPLLMEDGESVVRRCTLQKQSDSQIEYTRTDAFVEKTCAWLKEQKEIIGVSFQEDFLERFQKYMKGE